MSVLKSAKRCGCDAFDSGNRLGLEKFLRWFFSQDQELGENWMERAKRAEALTKEHKLEISKGKVISRDLVADTIQTANAFMYGELDRIFANELPAVLKGCDELAIQKRCLEEIKRLKASLDDKFKTPEETES